MTLSELPTPRLVPRYLKLCNKVDRAPIVRLIADISDAGVGERELPVGVAGDIAEAEAAGCRMEDFDRPALADLAAGLACAGLKQAGDIDGCQADTAA